MRWNTDYASALDGTLRSQVTGRGQKIGLRNFTEVPLGAYLVSDTGAWMGASGSGTPSFGVGRPPLFISPQNAWDGETAPLDMGFWFVFINARSGAFAAAKQVSAAVPATPGRQRLVITPADLLLPHGIGAPPQPNQDVVIPPDSPRVVVGAARAAGPSWIVLEQYWRRLPQSYSIAPGERRTTSYSTVSGMETTTSTQEQISASLGASASVGWGPLSASLSASLSAGSTTTHQVSTQDQTTTFASSTHENNTGQTRMFLYWELTNVITILDSKLEPKASVIYGAEDPPIIDEFDTRRLPARGEKETMAVSPGMLRLLHHDSAGSAEPPVVAPAARRA